MENAVDALKIAFGVLVFVIALTVAFALLSQAKATSDIMLFASDKTNYYTYSKELSEKELDGRLVGTDVVISSLYRYYKESVVVRVYDKNNTLIEEFNTETDGGLSQKERKKKYPPASPGDICFINSNACCGSCAQPQTSCGA